MHPQIDLDMSKHAKGKAYALCDVNTQTPNLVRFVPCMLSFMVFQVTKKMCYFLYDIMVNFTFRKESNKIHKMKYRENDNFKNPQQFYNDYHTKPMSRIWLEITKYDLI